MELFIYAVIAACSLVVLIIRYAFVYGHRLKDMPSGGQKISRPDRENR